MNGTASPFCPAYKKHLSPSLSPALAKDMLQTVLGCLVKQTPQDSFTASLLSLLTVSWQQLLNFADLMIGNAAHSALHRSFVDLKEPKI